MPEVQVGVAHPRRLDAHQHLVAHGLGSGALIAHQGLATFGHVIADHRVSLDAWGNTVEPAWHVILPDTHPTPAAGRAGLQRVTGAGLATLRIQWAASPPTDMPEAVTRKVITEDSM